MSDFRVCTPTEFLDADYPTRRKLVLAQIHATPERWVQFTFFTHTSCGTAACVAGWAQLLAGLEPRPLNGNNFGRGCELLGLTEDQGGHLFYGGRTLAEIEDYIAELEGR